MSGSISGNPWAITDRSGSVTLGGTAQVLMPANSQRRGYWVQNVSAGDLWITAIGTAAASQPGIKISPNSLYEVNAGTTPTTAVSIFGATTGLQFSAREW